MSQERFEAMLPIISADVIQKIVSLKGVAENEAIQMLYRSKLYELLEQEKTKLWQYSTHLLYSLLEQEWQTGTISFPDV